MVSDFIAIICHWWRTRYSKSIRLNNYFDTRDEMIYGNSHCRRTYVTTWYVDINKTHVTSDEIKTVTLFYYASIVIQRDLFKYGRISMSRSTLRCPSCWHIYKVWNHMPGRDVISFFKVKHPVCFYFGEVRKVTTQHKISVSPSCKLFQPSSFSRVEIVEVVNLSLNWG